MDEPEPLTNPNEQPQEVTNPSSEQSTSNSNDQKKENNEQQNIEQLMEEMKIDDQKEEGENDEEAKNEKEEGEKSAENESEALNETKYFVDISRDNIAFGKNTLFPGSIEELDIAINLKDQLFDENGNTNPFMLRVIAKCSNAEFDSLDEYVFSVRSNERFEYFEQVRFKIRKKQKALVKVAVKIPPVKASYLIEGVLEIQLQSLQSISLPISAKCQVPQIVCLKQLYKVEEGCSMIKIPGKKNQIRMPPIPFKNLSNYNFTLEVEALTNENFANRPYDIVTQNFVNCQGNTQFFVNLQLKQNLNYKGVMPVKDTIRKILSLKIRNSSVFFNFPLEVYVFESTNSGGMS